MIMITQVYLSWLFIPLERLSLLSLIPLYLHSIDVTFFELPHFYSSTLSLFESIGEIHSVHITPSFPTPLVELPPPLYAPQPQMPHSN